MTPTISIMVTTSHLDDTMNASRKQEVNMSEGENRKSKHTFFSWWDNCVVRHEQVYSSNERLP